MRWAGEMRAIAFKVMMTKFERGRQSKKANKIEMDLKETGYV
jgi:hypothetical protein